MSNNILEYIEINNPAIGTYDSAGDSIVIKDRNSNIQVVHPDYTAENVINKRFDLLNPNNITYPSTLAVFNSITGTTAEIILLFSDFTGSTLPNLYLSKLSFNIYSGTTIPNTYLSKSSFNTYSGTTVPTNYYNKTQINYFTGTTVPNNYYNKTQINYFTGTTVPNNYYNKTQINYYTGTTAINTFSKKCDTNYYTGTTAINTFSKKCDTNYYTGTTAINTFSKKCDTNYYTGTTAINTFSKKCDTNYYTGTTAINTFSKKCDTNYYTGTTAINTFSKKCDTNYYTGTTVPNTYYSKTQINYYTGTTAINTFSKKCDISYYTGTTLPNTYYSKTQINYYSGTTVPNTYLSKLSFNTYSGTTIPNTYYSKSQINYYSGTTVPNTYLSKSLFSTYTGTTAPNSFANKAYAITGATNLGTGSTIFNNITNNKINLKSIVVKGGLSISGNSNSVVITGGGGTLTGATNGLSVVNKNVSLGGTLSSDTIISGNKQFDLSLICLDSLSFNFSGSTITDNNLIPKGFINAADYSNNFVNESLVTKRYVTGLTSSSITGATNLSGGSNIFSNISNSKLNLRSIKVAGGLTISASTNNIIISGGSSVDTTAIHKTTAAEISAFSGKTTVVDSDITLIEDSATTPTAFGKKKITFSSIYNYIVGKTDIIYVAKVSGHSLIADSEIIKLAEYPNIPTISTGKYLGDSGSFLIVEPPSGGYANNLYLSGVPSDILGYDSLSYTPDTGTTTHVHTVNNSEGDKLLHTFIYPVGVSTTLFPSGLWSFNFYGSVDTVPSKAELGVTYFARHIDNSETDLFTIWSSEINNLVDDWIKFNTTNPTYNLIATDRMGARVLAKTEKNNDITITFYVGDGYGAYLNNPNKIRHSQLRDWNGDINYLHITNIEKSQYASGYTHSISPHAPSDAEKNVNADWNAISGDSFINNKPTTLPASDVYSWAKASVKPTYNQDEVGDGTTYKQFSLTEKNKLGSIASGATVGDTNAIHKAIAAEISAFSGKTTIVDADITLIEDSATTPTAFGKKKITFTSVYNYIKSKTDKVYSLTGHTHTGVYEAANSNIQSHISNSSIHLTTGQTATWNAKQDALTSGVNIKTINGTTLLGSGNIVASSGCGLVVVKDTGYIILTTDAYTTFSCNSSTTQTFFLPSVDTVNIGIEYTFVKLGTGAVIIDAADSDLIQDSGAGLSIYNIDSGIASITLKLITATQWVIINTNGTWITTF